MPYHYYNVRIVVLISNYRIHITVQIGTNLAILYSKGRDMEKAITSHRWLLENCNRREDAANYLIQLSRNFNRFKKYKYTIEVLEGSIDMTKTVEDEAQAETSLLHTSNVASS